MAAKGKAADGVQEPAAEDEPDTRVKDTAPAGVPVVAVINIYTPEREEPFGPGEVVMVGDTDEAMALIGRGHARAPTDGEVPPR